MKLCLLSKINLATFLIGYKHSSLFLNEMKKNIASSDIFYFLESTDGNNTVYVEALQDRK